MPTGFYYDRTKKFYEPLQLNNWYVTREHNNNCCIRTQTVYGMFCCAGSSLHNRQVHLCEMRLRDARVPRSSMDSHHVKMDKINIKWILSKFSPLQMKKNKFAFVISSGRMLLQGAPSLRTTELVSLHTVERNTPSVLCLYEWQQREGNDFRTGREGRWGWWPPHLVKTVTLCLRAAPLS